MDPYQVLGVPRNAPEQDIKRAFRQLSLQYHPDRNSTEEAKTKIVEINNAYEILSDAEKRKQYDTFGNVNDNNGGNGPNMSRTQSFHFEFGPGRGGPAFFHMGGPGRGGSINHVFEQMFRQGGGGNPFEQFFQSFSSQRKPEPIRQNITLTLDQIYTGTSIEIEWDRKIIIFDPPNAMGDPQHVHEEHIEKVKKTIPIPAGLSEQDVIQMEGEGHIWKPYPSVNMELPEIIRGDFQLKINITPHAHYQRQGMDMIYKKTLTLCDALCGTDFTIPAIGDRPLVNCRIEDTIVQPGMKKLFQGLGFKRDGQGVGNLILDFEIIFPTAISEEKRALLRQAFE